MDNRKEKLIIHLTEAFESFIKNSNENHPYGSMTIWYDEYGGSLELSKWKHDDFSYFTGASGNIELEGYDVFEEYKAIENDIKDFYLSLKDNENFKKLPLREGFRFVIASFDDNKSTVLDPLGTIPTNPRYSLNEAIQLILTKTSESLKSINSDQIAEITFTSSDGDSVISIITQNEKDEEYNRFPYPEYDFGLALTVIANANENGFENLCQEISKTNEFQSKNITNKTLFRFLISADRYYCCGFDQNLSKLKNLSEEEEIKIKQNL